MTSSDVTGSAPAARESGLAVLVVGGGGREHALVKALARDPGVTSLFAAPGNPGMTGAATLHPVDPLDGEAVVELARSLAVDLVVVGPEAPLVAGVADHLRAAGIVCFGPDAAAAAIEGSKAFAKDVMAAAGIPTAEARICRTEAEVDAALTAFGPPYVVKDDGLAAGKGVVVTDDRSAAAAHAASRPQVVVEEYLAGPEVSLFAVCDGRTVLPMLPAQDFKRLADGDSGPNTGGMGAYTPLPWAPPELVEETRRLVLQPALDELARRGTPFVGLLYAGLALTDGGIRVIEFNARFGDPETQALLELLETPLGDLLWAAATGGLRDFGQLRWKPGAAVVVVMASDGYPASPRSGDPISGLPAIEELDGVEVFHAGTAVGPDDDLVTAGGRVLGVTGTGADVGAAREAAYRGVDLVSFEGAQVRRDIAAGI